MMTKQRVRAIIVGIAVLMAGIIVGTGIHVDILSPILGVTSFVMAVYKPTALPLAVITAIALLVPITEKLYGKGWLRRTLIGVLIVYIALIILLAVAIIGGPPIPFKSWPLIPIAATMIMILILGCLCYVTPVLRHFRRSLDRSKFFRVYSGISKRAFARKYRVLLFVMLMFVCLSVYSYAGQLGVVQMLPNALTSNLPLYFGLLQLLCVMDPASAIATTVMSVASNLVGRGVLADLRKELDPLLNNPRLLHAQQKVASQISQLSGLPSAPLDAPLNTVFGTLVCVFSVGLEFAAFPAMTIINTITLVVVMTISMAIFQLIRRSSKRLQELVGEQLSIVQEKASDEAAWTITMLQVFEYFATRFAKSDEEVSQTGLRNRLEFRFNATQSLMILGLANLLILWVVGWGLGPAPSPSIVWLASLHKWLQITPGNALGDLTLATAVNGILRRYVPEIVAYLSRWAIDLGIYQNTFELLELPESLPQWSGTRKIVSPVREMRVENLGVELERDDGTKVQVAIPSLVATKGQLVCISAESGTGKTVTTRSIANQVDHKGKVMVVTQEGEEIPFEELAEPYDTFGYVFTNPPLLDASIAENISLGFPGATNEQKKEALKEMGDLLNAVGGDLTYRIGRAGSRLSQGQGVRVWLACWRLRQMRLKQQGLNGIFFYDEPLGNLDVNTRGPVISSLRNAANEGHIIFVISNVALDEILPQADYHIHLGKDKNGVTVVAAQGPIDHSTGDK